MTQFFKAITMARLFLLMAIICSFMIVITGSGVYLLSKNWVSEAKQSASIAVGKAVAQTLSAQLILLNKTLDKLVLETEVINAIKSGDPAGLTAVASKLEQQFPDVLKIRLFVAGVAPTDDQLVPKMGFADVEMVGKSFISKQLPAIQGDQGVDRHLAMTGRIMENNQVLGVVLVSLKFDFISNSVKDTTAKDGYIELMQGTLVLGVSGEKPNMDNTEKVEIQVPNSDWKMTYVYANSSSAFDISMMITLIIIPVLLTLLVFFTIHRKLSSLLAEDVNAVIKAVKDLMATQKLHSTYGVHLTEMAGVISTLAQFKRVMDSENNKTAPKNTLKDKLEIKPVVNDFEDLELDNFFDDGNG